MSLTLHMIGDDSLTQASALTVLYLRDFLLGYLAARGGKASIEEIHRALQRARRNGIMVAMSGWSLEDELELLEYTGLLEREDGSVKLVWDRLSRLARKKIEKVSKLLSQVA